MTAQAHIGAIRQSLLTYHMSGKIEDLYGIMAAVSQGIDEVADALEATSSQEQPRQHGSEPESPQAEPVASNPTEWEDLSTGGWPALKVPEGLEWALEHENEPGHVFLRFASRESATAYVKSIQAAMVAETAPPPAAQGGQPGDDHE